MSIARMNQEKVDMPMYEPKSTLYINMKKMKGCEKLDVGDTFSKYITGKVVSIRKDKETETMDIEVMKVEDDDMEEEDDE